MVSEYLPNFPNDSDVVRFVKPPSFPTKGHKFHTNSRMSHKIPSFHGPSQQINPSNIAMKHPRSLSSLSPSRERYGVRGVTRYNMGDVTDSLATKTTALDVSEKQSDLPSTISSQPSTTSTESCTVSAPLKIDCPAEPSRRRYARRCSATMYSLHNSARQVQIQHGDPSL
jgi:hypothetical protein